MVCAGETGDDYNDYDDYVPVVYDASGPFKEGVLYHDDGTMFYPAYTDDSKELPYDPARPPKWLKPYLAKREKEKRRKKQGSKKKCKGKKCKGKKGKGGKKGRKGKDYIGEEEHGTDYAEDSFEDVKPKKKPSTKRKSTNLSIKERNKLEGAIILT